MLNFLKQEKQKDYFINLMKFVEEEYDSNIIYPKQSEIFFALECCNIEDIKVVIIGQDPYINEGQAHGLAFSVANESIPPSLRNIYKELESDLDIKRNSTNLTDWAKQGILLINTILTVRASSSMSHKGKGWEIFSENLIKYIEDNLEDCIYILWGSYAQAYEKVIKSKYIIKAPHPSPLSAYRGFFGSRPFSKCNEILKELGKEPINW